MMIEIVEAHSVGTKDGWVSALQVCTGLTHFVEGTSNGAARRDEVVASASACRAEICHSELRRHPWRLAKRHLRRTWTSNHLSMSFSVRKRVWTTEWRRETSVSIHSRAWTVMTSRNWYGEPYVVDGVNSDSMMKASAHLCLWLMVVVGWYRLPSHGGELAIASHFQLAFRPPDVTSGYVLR